MTDSVKSALDREKDLSDLPTEELTFEKFSPEVRRQIEEMSLRNSRIRALWGPRFLKIYVDGVVELEVV